MKIIELINLERILTQMQNIQHTKFAYMILKNLKKIQTILKNLSEKNPISKEYVEYENKRIKLCEIYAQKDKDGNFIRKDDRFIITEDRKKSFKTEIEKLQFGYKSIIEATKKQQESAMRENIEIDLFKIKEKDLPDNLTASQLKNLTSLIEEGG